MSHATELESAPGQRCVFSYEKQLASWHQALVQTEDELNTGNNSFEERELALRQRCFFPQTLKVATRPCDYRQEELEAQKEQFAREKEEYDNYLDEENCELAERDEIVNDRGFVIMDRENTIWER